MLQEQYKEHISDYKHWDQKEHASEWMLFENNVGQRLGIDETALSNGELYTIVANKQARGRKGAIVAMDMAANMQLAIKRCFVNAHRVIDRFHVQKLAYDAVQEARIKYRWEALDAENEAIESARRNKTGYRPEILPNGDTLKQLLARSRYLLFKHHIKWTAIQKHRAELLFEHCPELKKAYRISLKLGDIFKLCKSREQAFKQLALWYNVVEDCGIDSFKTVARSIKANYLGSMPNVVE